MKSTGIRINPLAPVLGIALAALVAGALLGDAIHGKLESENRSIENGGAMMDRVRIDEGICFALRALHEGDAHIAVRQLDHLLCEDVLAVNSTLASLEPGVRAYINNTFARFSQVRPTCAALIAATGEAANDDEIAAERILARAANEIAPSRPGIAAPP